jgi:hypothetical protein
METQIDKTLYCIIPISNPRRYKRRYELYEQFIKRLLQFDGIFVITVEMTFGDRCAHCEYNKDGLTSLKHKYIKVCSTSEIWVKENLINIGVGHLPCSWKYMAWIDADIEFINKDWVSETIHQLQHYAIVQLFQNAIDLGPEGQALSTHKSFGYCYNNKPEDFLKEKYRSYKNYDSAHPGYAWACTRVCYDTMGGLMDFPILGSADRHMCYAFIALIDFTYPKNINQNYIKMLRAFEERVKPFWANIGYVKGTIIHNWHGKKKHRQYRERWSILVKHDYNPITDIRYEYKHLIALNNNKPFMRNDIQKYFLQRNEDSIDLE